MKQYTITKFLGRKNQANSFNQDPGSSEIAREIVFGNDNILLKPRGMRPYARLDDDATGVAVYKDSVYATTDDEIFRLRTGNGQEKTLLNSQTVVIRNVASISVPADGSYVQIDSPDAAIADAFPDRYGAVFGEKLVTTEFTLSVTRTLGTTLTATQNNHRLAIGDQVSIGPSATLGLTTATSFTILTVATNSYTVASAGANVTDAATPVSWLSAFIVQATELATATVTSTVNATFSGVAPVTSSVTMVQTEPQFVQAQSALFWTGDYKVYKMPAETGTVIEAGVPRGEDLIAEIVSDTGAFKPNSQVAYRVVFGYVDVNGYTLLSAPSSIATLVRNDTVSVTNANLSYATFVVTVTSVAHGLTTGDEIFLYLFTAVTSNGVPYTVEPGAITAVTVTGVNTFTINLETINQTNLEAVTDVTALTYGVGRAVRLQFTVPQGLPTGSFYQVYRTTYSPAFNVEPAADYRLVEQVDLTGSEFSIIYVDNTEDDLIAGNQTLYTNPNNEGELQANDRPPASTDIALFKGSGIFSDIWEDPSLEMAVINPNVMAPGDTIVSAAGGSLLTLTLYVAGDAANDAVGNELQEDPATVAGTTVTVTHNNHGLDNNSTIYVFSSSAGLTVAEGTYTISNVTANTFDFTEATPGVAGTLLYQAVLRSTGARYFKRVISAGAITISEAIAQTAQNFVKAINQDGTFPLVGLYTSGPADAPGKLILINDTPQYSGTTVFSSGTTANGFAPALTLNNAIVQSKREKNVVAASKPGEFEAVPPAFRFPVGSADAAVLGVESLRDCIIVIKEDGVFRITGDTPFNYSTTAIDNTVICKAKNSITKLNNSVYFISTQGVVQVTDSGVRIVSRDIENDITPLLTKTTLPVATGAVGYETERFYMLATLKPNSNAVTADWVHVYHYLTEQWSTLERPMALFKYAEVSKDDVLYTADGAYISQERKDQLKTDLADEEFPVIPKIGIIATVDVVSGSTTARVTNVIKHGLKTGDKVTLSFQATGTADVTPGVYYITRVNDFVFTYTRGSAAVTTSSGYWTWIKGAYGVEVTTDVTNGLQAATFTFSASQDLSVFSNIIVVQQVSTALSAVTDSGNDILGPRVIQSVLSNVMSILLTDVATGTVTGTSLVSDGSQNTSRITIETTSGEVPQQGDSLYIGTQLIPILDVTPFDDTNFILELSYPIFAFDLDNVHLLNGILSVYRSTPITTSDVGMIKYFSEAQASFRNADSCTMLQCAFANDSNYLSQDVSWDNRLGTFRLPLLFGTWGALPWGEFPWGGVPSIERESLTSPAAIFRTFVPKEAFIGTFIQLQIAHRVAGEPFEMQSMSFFHRKVSERTSR